MRQLLFPTILIALLFTTLFYGCKKNNSIPQLPASEYYFRCKMDGSLKEFHILDSAHLSALPVNGAYTFSVGATDDAGSLNSMSVYINEFDTVPITVGKTYKTIVSNHLVKSQAGIVYSNLTGDAYTSVLTSYGPPYESAEITLTEITATYIKGTFKGKLLFDETVNSDYKYDVTDGEFYLPRAKEKAPPGSGDDEGFVEGILEGDTFRVRENGDVTILTSASFFLETGTVPNLYSCLVIGNSNPLTPGYKSYNLIFRNEDEFTDTASYIFNESTPLKFHFTLQTKNSSGNLVTYVSNLISANDTVNSVAAVRIDKFTKVKGEYIEGGFFITDGIYKDGSDVPLSLMYGRFKVKVK